MKVKIEQECLEKLDIVDKLRKQKGFLDCTRYYDIDTLAGRLVCNPVLLLEVLESMGVEIIDT